MNTRSVLVLVGLWVILTLPGCGSSERIISSYDDPNYVISYQSSRITLQERPQEWLLSVQAFTGCRDLPCTPDDVRLVFFSRPPRPRYADDHRLRIDAGGIRLEWPGPSYDRPAYSEEDGTQRISVVLSYADFRDLALSDTVEGRLGPTPWTLSYEQRASLRSIIRQFE